jgi:hypothetical protein
MILRNQHKRGSQLPNAIGFSGADAHKRCRGMSPLGTFETCRQTLRMSVFGGRPEVSGRLSKRRF